MLLHDLKREDKSKKTNGKVRYPCMIGGKSGLTICTVLDFDHCPTLRPSGSRWR